jgi:hypothetical protein
VESHFNFGAGGMHFGMRLYFSTLFRKHQNQKTTPFQQQVRTPESQEGTASKPDLNITRSNFKERNAVQKSNATAAISNRHPPNVFTTAMSCVCPFQFLCHPLRSGALAQPQSSAAHLVVNDLKGPTRAVDVGTWFVRGKPTCHGGWPECVLLRGGQRL